MLLSERQKEILESVVEEYVKNAFPVSSHLLEKEYDFGFSPATIRSELQILTEKGYLLQPHVSAGRVPTDKGYRFFVDELLEEEIPMRLEELKSEDPFFLVRELSQAYSGLVFSYTFQDRRFLKEGWEELLQEPEFQEGSSIRSLTQFLKDLEANITYIEVDQCIDLYIGKENPFSNVKDFSMIFSAFPRELEGIVALIGPTRMRYDKNINLLKEILYGKQYA